MDAGTYSNDQVKAELAEWVFIKVDILKDQETPTALEVAAVPEAIALTAKGEILGRKLNFVPADTFLQWLQDLKSRR